MTPLWEWMKAHCVIITVLAILFILISDIIVYLVLIPLI